MTRANPINAFNRILLLVLGALALVAGVIALLLVAQVIHPADVSLGGFLQDFWQGIANLSGGSAITAVIISILVALAGLALIVVELLPPPREAPTYVVRKDGLGTVTVARKSVRQVAQYEATQIAGVREVRSEVRNGADGIHIITHASLAPDTVAPAVGEQLQVNIKEAVQRHLGLPVAEVQVHTQVEALDTTRRVR
ncbi:MAG TPA: alkaline shock response membrane anchor protein AmaP [Ktedonobacterales bacterium]|jgi:uncharacterized alkaline shock family protein YloU